MKNTETVTATMDHSGRFGLLIAGEAYDASLPNIQRALEEAPQLFAPRGKKSIHRGGKVVETATRESAEER